MSLVSTPYDAQRQRLRKLERMEALRLGQPLAATRDRIARALRLTPDQLTNIRKGKLKDLYGAARSRIDHAFVDAARGTIADLQTEMAHAAAATRPVDPGALAKAQASIDALDQLIGEALGRDARRTTRATREDP